MPSDRCAPTKARRISRASVVAAGRQAEAGQRDHRVAPPVGEPGVAGDDRRAVRRLGSRDARRTRNWSAASARRAASADSRRRAAHQLPVAARARRRPAASSIAPRSVLGRHHAHGARLPRARTVSTPGTVEVLLEVEAARAFLGELGRCSTSSHLQSHVRATRTRSRKAPVTPRTRRRRWARRSAIGVGGAVRRTRRAHRSRRALRPTPARLRREPSEWIVAAGHQRSQLERHRRTALARQQLVDHGDRGLATDAEDLLP